jgi:hypothetical protein
MADDLDAVKASLAEIKLLLENKKKEKGNAITEEIFTDPRFFEIFESYFKPLVESSKEIKGRLTEKKKISVFDVIGLSERTQETKRNALNKEIDKLTEKLRNIAKNLGNVRNYTLSDVFGLTKTERNINRRIVNNAIRTLSMSIHRSARNLSDPTVVMKFIGLKPIKMPERFELPKVEVPVSKTKGAPTTKGEVEPPVVIDETVKGKRKKKVKVESEAIDTAATPAAKPTPPVDTTAPTPTAPVPPPTGLTSTTPTTTLSEKEDRAREVVPVAIVEISDSLQEWFEHVIGRGMGNVDFDKGKHTDTDREAYSHSWNAIARLLTLGATLLAAGIPALITGLFDQGPLKGVKKIIAAHGLQMAANLGKSILHYIGNVIPKFIMDSFGETIKLFTKAFKGKLGAEGVAAVAKSGAVTKAGVRLLGWLGKVLKWIPGIGALISIGFAINRFANGDIQGGLIDLASGAASTIPVVGTAISIGLDIVNAQADLASGGVTSNKKGWLGKLNNYISKLFAKIIYASLSKLPFGLGEKVAGWLGLGSMAGLAMSASEDENVEVGVNPTIDRATERIKMSQNVRTKAEDRQKTILNGRSVEQLSEVERAEYDRQTQVIERADKNVEDQRTIIRGARINKPAEPAKPAGPTRATTQTAKQPDPYELSAEDKAYMEKDAAEQRAAAEAERQEEMAAEAALRDEEPAEMRVERPYVPPEKPRATDDEAVSTLKKINDNLEVINAKTVPPSVDRTTTPPALNVSAVTGGGGGASGPTPLQFALEAVRDTCYTIREKNRGMILDYRAFA